MARSYTKTAHGAYLAFLYLLLHLLDDFGGIGGIVYQKYPHRVKS